MVVDLSPGQANSKGRDARNPAGQAGSVAKASRRPEDPAPSGGTRNGSVGFAALVPLPETQGRDLIFVIGGHAVLPAGWRERADLLASLGRIMMPHEFARAVLAEQIYRAFTMLRGHPYPR